MYKSVCLVGFDSTTHVYTSSLTPGKLHTDCTSNSVIFLWKPGWENSWKFPGKASWGKFWFFVCGLTAVLQQENLKQLSRPSSVCFGQYEVTALFSVLVERPKRCLCALFPFVWRFQFWKCRALIQYLFHILQQIPSFSYIATCAPQ